jgi:uncharacterized membrane protein YdbT with pleckstrin-like domain
MIAMGRDGERERERKRERLRERERKRERERERDKKEREEHRADLQRKIGIPTLRRGHDEFGEILMAAFTWRFCNIWIG